MAIQIEDIIYQSPNGMPLLARLYRPGGTGPFPAVLEVHGGAWTSGDRLNNVSIAESLASDGIVVLSIDFRMPPAAAYPAASQVKNHHHQPRHQRYFKPYGHDLPDRILNLVDIIYFRW